MERLLVANRAEIAHRIIDTAIIRGLETVAVYSELDRELPFVMAADEAVLLTGSTLAETYLSIDAIIEAARKSGADAVHPGYGFLSENAEFADACRQAGLVFVGPSADAIEQMGDKDTAKEIAASAGLPVLAGYEVDPVSEEEVLAQAEEIGFPLLIKARSGGGGRGMRLVNAPADLISQLDGARQEAGAAFADERLILERYVPNARHIEVQVVADQFGTILTLGDRDCTLQRRHQKVVEEAPAPDIPDHLRQAMADAAVSLAAAVDYQGLGTLEFVAQSGDDGQIEQFWFIEMNTRLQVEHPVTEMVTGLDLVGLQLLIASGEMLPLAQDEIHIDGHAVEARINAEDPTRQWAPTSGLLANVVWPMGLRCDAGYQTGNVISDRYDGLIGKLMAHGTSREAAMSELLQGLLGTTIVGPATNIGFLINLLSHEDVQASNYGADFIGDELAELTEPKMSEDWLGETFLRYSLQAELEAQLDELDLCGVPTGPFDEADGFQLSGRRQTSARLVVDGVEQIANVEWGGVLTDFLRKSIAPDGWGGLVGQFDGWTHHCRMPAAPQPAQQFEADSQVVAPFHGRIIDVSVAQDAVVEAGDVIMRLEAMKMEHVIVAPAAGEVTVIHVAPGEQVAAGDLLAELTPADEDDRP